MERSFFDKYNKEGKSLLNEIDTVKNVNSKLSKGQEAID